MFSRRRLTLALTVVVVVAGSATVLSLVQARRHLTAARTALEAGRDDLTDGDLEQARQAIDGARDELLQARGWLGQPQVRLLGAVPALGNSVRTSRTITDAAVTVTEAGRDLAGALHDVQQTLDESDGDGRLPVDGIARLRGPAARMATDLDRAIAATEASPSTWLPGSLAEGRREFLDLLRPLAADANRAARLVARLPDFLGASGPRRYFFGVANPAELRGTGGYVGSYALLRLEDGRLDFGPFRETSSLPAAPNGAVTLDAPQLDVDSLRDRYARYGWPRSWQNANLSPDFPAAGHTFEALWDVTFGDPVGGQPIDGVIVVDPFAFASLLDLEGPIEVPGLDTVLTAENVVEYVTNRAYAEIEDNERRKEVLGGVAATALARFLDGISAGDLRAAADSMAGLIDQRHLLIHARDPAIQEVFADLGLDGRMRDPIGDYLLLAANSGTGTKLDYYLDRELTYEVNLLGDGFVAGRLTATFGNDAPTEGLPSRVIGPVVDTLDAGENRLLTSAFCAVGCIVDSGPEDASDLDAPDGHEVELGHGVASAWLDLPSGQYRSLDWAWTTPDGWWWEHNELVYRLTYQHQTSIRPTRLTVRVAIPDGFEVRDLPGDAVVENGAVIVTRAARSDVTFEVRLVRS